MRISTTFYESDNTTMESIDNVDRSYQIEHKKGQILRKPKELRLVVFTDSDYANDEKDRKSITRGVVTMGGSPTYFTSKMQTTISLSSMEAKYIALGMITQEVMFQAQILDKLFGEKRKRPIIIYEDNLGAIYLTKYPQISQRTKFIGV